MVIIRKYAWLLLIIFSANLCFASDITEGSIRLILDKKTGGFSLYYLTDPRKRAYEPLFDDKDGSGTSFISVMVDGVVYKPSASKQFITRIETPHGQPSLVFESSFVLIRQIFTPVKTLNANSVNGVQITTTIQNKRNKESFIGFRMLIDTSLGEQRGRVPFITNTRLIQKEKIIDTRSGELFWISKGKNAALMGSIVNPIDSKAKQPDYLHFANWKRLYDSNWELEYKEDRSFTYSPYSTGDSAVCYYYMPTPVEAGAVLTLSVILTTDDPEWYSVALPQAVTLKPEAAVPVPPATSIPAAEPEAAQEPEIIPAAAIEEPVIVSTPLPEPELIPEPEIITEPVYEPEPDPEVISAVIEYPHLNTAQLRELYELQDTLNRFIDGQIHLNEDDLLEIERTINRLKTGH